MDEKTIARFWGKVDKNGPVPEHRPELGPCWVWLGIKTNGYGYFWVAEAKRKVRAHRVAWQLYFGTIPDGDGSYHGTCVLHHCDNRACVRDTHIFVGTQLVNMIDKCNKGRSATSGSTLHGDSRINTKLTPDAVREIRKAYAAGGSSYRILGELFGVSAYNVYAIVLRKTWTHL